MTPALPPDTPPHKHQQLDALLKMFGDTPLPDASPLPVRYPDDPAADADRVCRAFRAAYEAVQEEHRDEDLPIDMASPLGRMFSAAHRMADHWKARTAFLERTLRFVLASDLVTNDQRTEILSVLCGRAKVGRDPKLLNEYEAELIRLYRAGNAADKAMVRNLFSRLWGGANDGRDATR